MALQIDSITPTSINATVGDVVELSCEVSGVSPIGAFANKPLPSTTLEACNTLHVDYANNVYVGAGTTLSTDSVVYKSGTIGESWEGYAPAVVGTSIAGAICSNSTGTIYHSASDFVGSFTAFCKNGVAQTTKYGYLFSFFGLVFDNGNVCFGHQMASDAAVITISIDGGLTYNNAVSVASNTKFHSAVKINGTSALAVTKLGNIYRTTNSGVSWSYLSQVSGTAGGYSLGQLGTRLICSRSGTVAWFQSVDSGASWITYTAGAPTTTPYAYIRNYNGTTCFGAVSAPDVYINVNDTSWVKYSINNADLELVYDVAIVSGNILACTGYSSGGDGRVYRASAGAPVFKLIDTSDSSVLSTVSPYNYTADIADDNKNFQWSVTDGVTTVQSALIPVSVYEELQIVSVNPETVDTTVGQTVTFSCTTSGGDGAVSLELRDASDDTVLATSSPFSLLIESPISTYFKWVATDGSSTVESALIPVLAVETNTIHETGGIIRGSIGNFKYTPIEKCYNDFSVEYGDGLKISISKVDQSSFPSYILGDWESYVSGVPSYADAKELWTIARNSYLLNSRVRTAPDERSKLAYSVDRNQFYNSTAYDTTEEYARQYVQLFTEWATRQKLEVKYSLPMTSDNAKLELMQVVYFSDVIITPEVGEYGKGWITSIQCDTENDVVKVGLTFEPDFFLPPSLIVTGDIIETGYSTADIIETGTQTNNVIESGL